jgi:hypothetical protein
MLVELARTPAAETWPRALPETLESHSDEHTFQNRASFISLRARVFEKNRTVLQDECVCAHSRRLFCPMPNKDSADPSRQCSPTEEFAISKG